MTDPEDVLRAQEGRYSKKYEASYGDDEYSQWLLANGQASSGFFESKYYKEAYNSVMLNRAEQERVKNFKKAVVQELVATAENSEHPTNDEIAEATLRIQRTNPMFAGIDIVNPKTSDSSYDGYFSPALAEQEAAESNAEKRSNALYLDDVYDAYYAAWDSNERRKTAVADWARSRVDNIISSAITNSGYNADMQRGTGLAYDSRGAKEYEDNYQRKKEAATAAVEQLSNYYDKAQIQAILEQDGRLSYMDSQQKINDDVVTAERRADIDMMGNQLLGLSYENEKGQKVVKVSETPTQQLIKKAQAIANMGTAARAGFSPISMDDNWQAENLLSDNEKVVLNVVMENARSQLASAGFGDFEVDEYFRRADLGEYIPPEQAMRNALIASGMDESDVQNVLDSYTDEDWANAQRVALDLAAIEGVSNSTIDQLGYSIISMPVTAAFKVASSFANFADMVAGDPDWAFVDTLNEKADRWAEIGHDSNHKVLSTMSEVGSEIFRILAVSKLGAMAGGASAATNGMSWIVSQAGQRIPFIASAMGSYYGEAKAGGASSGEATKYALIAGTVEGILESLAIGDVMQSHLGSKLFSKKVVDGTGVSRQLFAKYGLPLADIIVSSVGEGLEESLSYVASGLARRGSWDNNYKMSWDELGENFMGGLLIGGIMSGLAAPANSQRYKYATEMLEKTGTYTTDFDSLYAASYFETRPQAQRDVLTEKYNNGEIVADKNTRKEAIKAERELDAISREVTAKQQALEAARVDAKTKVEQADKKVADMEQRIATLRETDNTKKAKKIAELTRQLNSARKAQAEVRSEAEKKVKTAESDYTSILDKQTTKAADLEETIANYQAAKYFTDFYGIPQKPAQNAPVGGQVAMPITNTTDTANVAQNPIDTVKMETVEVAEPVVAETAEVPTETVVGADGVAMGIVDPKLQETTTAVQRTARKLKQAFISSFAEGERFSKLQAQVDKGAVTVEDSAQLLRNAGGTVDYIMEDDLVDLNRKSMGRESYAAVMTPPDGIDFSVAQDYLLNLHNIDRMNASEAKAVMANEDGSVRTAEQSQQIVKEMEAKYPELVNWNAKRRQWWNTFGKEWFVNSGLVSQADWEKWQKAFPNYVPTFRTKYEDGLGSSSIYNTTVSVGGKVKHLVGGTSEIVDVRDSFARYINSIVRATAKNDVILNLYNFAQQHPNAAASYVQILDNTGKTSSDITPDAFADSLEAESFTQVVKGKYILNGKVDGKTVSMAVSKDIYDGVADLFGRKYNPAIETVMDIGKKLTTPIKAGITTYNPLFAISNAIRDTQTAYINDEGVNPLYFGKSLFDSVADMHNNSEDFQRFKAYGGDRTGFYNSTTGYLESAGINSTDSKLKKDVKKLGKVISAAGEYTETLNRYAAFKRYLDRHGRTEDNYRKAINAAAEGTTNFSRSGAATKVADAWCMYLNANIQGIDKMVRQYTSKDTAIKSLGKTAGIAIASILVKYLTNNDENEHYHNLSNYVKDNNLVIPNYFGEKDANGYHTTFIALPKAQGYGVVISAFERAATMLDEDKSFSEAYDGYLDTLTGALPVSPSTPLSAIKQAINNESWSGATIEPSRMESEPVTERYDSETSVIAINISELLDRMGVEFSPMKVQYVLDQDLGIIADTALPATYVQNYDNYGEEGQEYDPQSAIKSVFDPMKARFVKDPLYSNDIVGNFYDELDEMEQLSKQAKSDRQSAGIDTKSDAEKAYSRWNDMSWWLTDSYKQERAVMASEPNTPKRDEKIRAIRKERVDAVKAFMENPDTYKIPN